MVLKYLLTCSGYWCTSEAWEYWFRN